MRPTGVLERYERGRVMRMRTIRIEPAPMGFPGRKA